MRTGKLVTKTNDPGLLPTSDQIFGDGSQDFVSGDIRVMENPGLQSLHTRTTFLFHFPSTQFLPEEEINTLFPLSSIYEGAQQARRRVESFESRLGRRTPLSRSQVHLGPLHLVLLHSQTRYTFFSSRDLGRSSERRCRTSTTESSFRKHLEVPRTWKTMSSE